MDTKIQTCWSQSNKDRRMANSFRCDYCGRFIAYDDISTGKAECYMVTPDSEVSVENYASHHLKCKAADLAQGGRG